MALSAAINTPYQSRGPIVRRRLLSANSVTWYFGDLVMITSAGLATPCAALASNRGIVGVYMGPTVASGTGGATFIEVAEGEFLLPATSGTQDMVQSEIFGQADSTVGATASNLPIAGICTEFQSATRLWTFVGPNARI